MHPLLAAALAPVLRDLRTTGAPVPVLVEEAWASEELAASVLMTGPWGSSGLALRFDQSPVEQLADVTDQVADWVVDELWERGPWPVCPGHQHPMRVSHAGVDVVWACPADGRAVAVVGSLV